MFYHGKTIAKHKILKEFRVINNINYKKKKIKPRKYFVIYIYIYNTTWTFILRLTRKHKTNKFYLETSYKIKTKFKKASVFFWTTTFFNIYLCPCLAIIDISRYFQTYVHSTKIQDKSVKATKLETLDGNLRKISGRDEKKN